MKTPTTQQSLTFLLRYMFLAIAAVMVAVTAGCGDGHDDSPGSGDVGTVLVRGAPMVGGANGRFFDRDDTLYVANVFGQTISQLDPESGEVKGRLGRSEGVGVGADDLTIDAFGTLYWTDPTLGTVKAKPEGEEAFVIAESFPRANPITIGDDDRLYFAQCFYDGPNGIFEGDPAGAMVPRVIREEDPDCASNAMDWWDGKLYSPRWFEGRVVSVDIESGQLTDITTNWGAPAAVKFNSRGELYGVNQGNGEVARIDLNTGEREVLAVFPEGWLDSLAFDSSDRLFVSSASEGTVAEILDNGKIREVSPGGMIVPMGLARIDNTLYVTELATVRGFNLNSGKEVYTLRSTFGLGDFKSPTNVSAVGDKLIMMSFISNQLLIWDLTTDTAVAETSLLLPVDAEPFEGDLLVTEIGAGRITRVRLPDLVERETVAEGLNFPAGLAVYDDDVYVSDSVQGTVFRVIHDGEVLAELQAVATDLEVPEGITITPDGKHLLVVEGDVSRLTQIDLETGSRITIAEDLQFQPRKAIPGLITHWFNDVEVDGSGRIYVNSDAGNVIYRFNPEL